METSVTHTLTEPCGTCEAREGGSSDLWLILMLNLLCQNNSKIPFSFQERKLEAHLQVGNSNCSLLLIVFVMYTVICYNSYLINSRHISSLYQRCARRSHNDPLKQCVSPITVANS